MLKLNWKNLGDFAEKTMGWSEGATKLYMQGKCMENNDNKMVRPERVAWSLWNILQMEQRKWWGMQGVSWFDTM